MAHTAGARRGLFRETSRLFSDKLTLRQSRLLHLISKVEQPVAMRQQFTLHATKPQSGRGYVAYHHPQIDLGAFSLRSFTNFGISRTFSTIAVGKEQKKGWGPGVGAPGHPLPARRRSTTFRPASQTTLVSARGARASQIQ